MPCGWHTDPCISCNARGNMLRYLCRFCEFTVLRYVCSVSNSTSHNSDSCLELCFLSLQLVALVLGAAVCVTAACGNVHSCAREPDTSHWATTSLGNFYCKSEIKRSCAIVHGIFSSSFVVICSARGARAAGGLAAGDCVSVPPLPSSLHSRRGVNTVLQYV